MKNKNRKIIHVDMDAFYASIEELLDPTLKNKPLVVAQDPRKTGGHGVVATASYNARKYGIHSAMSSMEALKLCPNAVFRFSGFDFYRKYSAIIHEVFNEYTDIVESYALDEAYLDVTKNKLEIDDPIQVAREIQTKIWQRTKLTCSVGVSYSKFLAKEASDYAKPAGITIIDHKDALEFLANLSIKKFRGVGKKTVPKMHELGINNGADLLEWEQLDLIKYFGKFGHVLYERARGIDNRPVEANRIRKSIGKERTYGTVLVTDDEVQTALSKISQLVAREVIKQKKHGKTLVLKIRFSDFVTYTKRISFDRYINNDETEFFSLATELLEEVPEVSPDRGVRLLGITITNLDDLSYENLDLFK
ncbi:DNA polymerase IV [Lentilactobacillus sp. SPB1-3]|uniref:DNA polymerase IV n=1 Tax=Lentilactobacillus terminaliae TaxID=3003483 RepID=A0ACD5DCC8_9LACO|nr:DNA polymerase IV [Lentilactobacillus sp. SPB1-3]MCZ0977368.1 DNA polymerase IV [Lentilactobacillus sp. SPB1-3]